MKLTDMIEINPRVCGGTPVICGTRIPVSVLIGQLAGGESWAGLRAGYPELTDAAISAALLFAKRSIERNEFVFAEAS